MSDQANQPDIYPMPSFPTLAVNDIELSARWYQDALGFQHVFTLPGPSGKPVLVHLRWTKYADLLLRQQGSAERSHMKGIGIMLSFGVFDGRVDDIADRARRSGASLRSEPQDQPWNARDFSIEDPDGFVLTFTQGPVDPRAGMDRIIARSTRPGSA